MDDGEHGADIASTPGMRAAIKQLQARLQHYEQLLDPASQAAPARAMNRLAASRWPVVAAVVAAVGLQAALPDRFAPGHRLVPFLELILLAGLVMADPRGQDLAGRWMRRFGMVLVALITASNAWSALRLVTEIVQGKQEDALELLSSGAAIWATNVVVFGLWYWHLDRGGPLARHPGHYPDFVFPQRQNPDDAAPDWSPTFPDYLYLAFTNATAFSPTDVMPYTIRAKMIMMLQATVSLLTITLVIARAIGLFK
jgi:uncharacterized membrane protein